MHPTQLNAIELAKSVRKRVVDFTASDLFVRDAGLTGSLLGLWGAENSVGSLVGDLWVEGAFPPEISADTLRALVDGGVLHPALRDTLLRNRVFSEDMCLYKHQSESLRHASAGFNQAEKPAVVVTTGTGAGKTEGFSFSAAKRYFPHAGANWRGCFGHHTLPHERPCERPGGTSPQLASRTG